MNTAVRRLYLWKLLVEDGLSAGQGCAHGETLSAPKRPEDCWDARRWGELRVDGDRH